MGDTHTIETDFPLAIKPDIIPTQWWYWLGLLLGPAGILLICTWTSVPWSTSVATNLLEYGAIALTSLACVVLILKAVIGRDLFYIMMAIFSVAAVCREIHWDWTHRSFYLVVAGLGVWGFAKRDQVFRWLVVRPHIRAWFMTTGINYVLALLMARRAFEYLLPKEEALHTPIEELTEDVAHLSLLVLALLPSVIARGGDDESSSRAE